jgi:hypothetical protein
MINRSFKVTGIVTVVDREIREAHYPADGTYFIGKAIVCDPAVTIAKRKFVSNLSLSPIFTVPASSVYYVTDGEKAARIIDVKDTKHVEPFESLAIKGKAAAQKAIKNYVARH